MADITLIFSQQFLVKTKALTFVRSVISAHGLMLICELESLDLLVKTISNLAPDSSDSSDSSDELLTKTTACNTALQLLCSVLTTASHLREHAIELGALKIVFRIMQGAPRTIEWFPALLRASDILQVLFTYFVLWSIFS